MLRFGVHCQKRVVATHESLFSQNRAIHHEPLLGHLVKAQNAEQLSRAVIQLIYQYNLKYSESSYGGGGGTCIYGGGITDHKCGKEAETSQCDRCASEMALRGVDGALTGKTSDDTRRFIHSLIHLPYEATKPGHRREDPRLTSFMNPTTSITRRPYQVDGTIVGLYSHYPFTHEERLERIAHQNKNAGWLRVGASTPDVTPFFISMAEWAFRYCFADFMFGTASTKRFRLLDASELQPGLPCETKGSAVSCYRCQLVQRWMNLARDWLVSDEFKTQSPLIRSELIRLFHGGDLEAQPTDAHMYMLYLESQSGAKMHDQLSALAEAAREKIKPAYGQPTRMGSVSAASAAYASSVAAAEADHKHQPPPPERVHDAKVSAVRNSGAVAEDSEAREMIDHAVQTTVGVTRKRPADNPLVNARIQPNTILMNKRLEENMRAVCDGASESSAAGWRTIARFPVTTFMADGTDPLAVSAIYHRILDAQLLEFARKPRIDYSERAPDDYGIWNEVRKPPVSYANAAILRLLAAYPRMRFLKAGFYDIKLITAIEPYIRPLLEQFRKDKPAEFELCWIDDSSYPQH